jgi:hypothetical protein
MYAKSNNNPKEKHKSKLLIGEKNRWKGKGKDTRSGWKETIGIYIYIYNFFWLFVDYRYIKIYPTESTEALIPDDERLRTELRGSNCCGPIFSKDLQNLVNIVA